MSEYASVFINNERSEEFYVGENNFLWVALDQFQLRMDEISEKQLQRVTEYAH